MSKRKTSINTIKMEYVIILLTIIHTLITAVVACGLNLTNSPNSQDYSICKCNSLCACMQHVCVWQQANSFRVNAQSIYSLLASVNTKVTVFFVSLSAETSAVALLYNAILAAHVSLITHTWKWSEKKGPCWRQERKLNVCFPVQQEGRKKEQGKRMNTVKAPALLCSLCDCTTPTNMCWQLGQTHTHFYAPL